MALVDEARHAGFFYSEWGGEGLICFAIEEFADVEGSGRVVRVRAVELHMGRKREMVR